MHKINNILSKKEHDKCFKYHKPEDFINHGLGFIHKDEHDKLIKIGAIKCNGKEDCINSDQFVVKVKNRNGDFDTVFEGNERDCYFEKDRINKEGKTSAKVSKYPKAYIEYYKINEKKDYAENLEEQAMDNLVEKNLADLVNF